MTSFRHEFVRFIPDTLEEHCLYVSIEFASAGHNCACGCGTKVVTPISPTDWSVTYDGETVSLNPSIGNWSLPCRSHYFLRGGQVVWAAQWSDAEIEAGRLRDAHRKGRFFAKHRLQSAERTAIGDPSSKHDRDPVVSPGTSVKNRK